MPLLLLLFLASCFSFVNRDQLFHEQRKQLLQHQSNAADPINYSYFNQKVDHFDPSNTATFTQRYLINDEYYEDSHILLYYLNGEGTLSQSTARGGYHSVLAQKYKALIVCLEHRYYGESNPVTDLTTPNMKYLNSSEALADAAYFLEYVVNDLRKDDNITKVVVIGGSYTGAVSAWFRMEYPHLVVGSIASSAPIYLKEDFYEYDELTSSVLSDECRVAVRDAMDQITDNVDDSDTYAAMQNATGCAGIANTTDFLYVLSDAVSYAVQYNDEASPTVDMLCDIMTNTTYGNLTERMFKFFTEMMTLYQSTCLGFSSAFEVLNVTTLDPSSYSRQWFYQTCTEFGYFTIASSDDEKRTRSKRINIEYHEDICNRLFDVDVNITPTQQRYQQDDMFGTNIIWTNGGADPWSTLSITPPSNSSASSRSNVELTLDGRAERQRWTVLLIENGSHCTDLSRPTSSDSASLNATRKTMEEVLDTWLLTDDSDSESESSSESDTPNTASIVLLVIGILVFLVGCCLFFASLCGCFCFGNDFNEVK